MRTRLIIREGQLTTLRGLLFGRPDVEGAAFLLCGEARSDSHVTLITHEVLPIAPDDFLRRETYGLTINSRALSRITKLARYECLSIVFAHSHPGGTAHFSTQDDGEEERLLPFLQGRVPDRVHGTLVLNETAVVGRLYLPARTALDKILVVGRRFSVANPASGVVNERFFDRQVRAFGPDIQRLLGRLHIGIVGLGGTGSPVAEQLYRLGVGELSLFDGDRLAESNLSRVYGATVADINEYKVVIAKRRLDAIGFDTHVTAFPESINRESVARQLRHCDVVFGCTDKQAPRAILTQLSQRYGIPAIDLGVLIDSHEGQIRGVFGRITTLQAGEACLFCRGRINAEAIRLESLAPEDRIRQEKDGYAPELDDPAPAVIAFTSAVASAGVAELLHRLTGFMGSDRESTEVLIAFDLSRIRTNRSLPREDCFCSDQSQEGRGDEDPFLGMVWATHTT